MLEGDSIIDIAVVLKAHMAHDRMDEHLINAENEALCLSPSQPQVCSSNLNK